MLLDPRNVERADRPRDQEEPDREPDVTDPVHEERLLAGHGVLDLVVPEADEEIQQSPTPSQPTKSSGRFAPRTSTSIAVRKRFRYAKKRAKPGSSCM